MKIIKKAVSLLVALTILASFTAVFGCKSKGLTISETSLKMSMFESKTLTVDTKLTDFVWESTDENVLTIESDGKNCTVIAVGDGSASVIVTSGNKGAKCDVTVTPTEDTLSLALQTADTLLLSVGETSDIKAKVSYKDLEFDKATIKYEAITVSPSGAITIDENGKVTAVAKGTATIKVQGALKGNVTNELYVTVHSIPLIDIQLNTQSVSLFSDSRYPTTASISANYNVDGIVTVATATSGVSADESVAKFENGMIKAVGIGMTTVKLTYVYQEGLSFDKIVTVTVKDIPQVKVYATSTATVGNMALSNGDAVVYGNTAQLAVDSVTVDGKTVVNPVITWSVKTGDEGKVSVDNSGVVTGKLNGTATVIATYVDEYGVPATAECTVTVNGPVYYGKHAYNGTTTFNHSGIVAELNEVENSAKVSSVKFSNIAVPAASAENQQLIRFQYIPSQTTLSDGSLTEGPRNLEITIQDANNLDKYFTVAVIRTSNSSTRAGVRTSAMGDYLNEYFGYSKTDNGVGSSARIYGSSSGWAVSGLAFDFRGAYLDTTATNYENNMMGISLSGTTVYLHVGGNAVKLWDMNTDTKNYATSQGGLTTAMAWESFNPTAVNIYVRGSSMYNALAVDPTTFIVVDTLGGTKITESNANGYILSTSYILTGYNGSASVAGGKPVVAI